jgi:hypothetical protein
MDEVSALDPSIIVISGSAGIGNYLVYRDQSHVTASYMRFLVPELERLLPLAAR